MVDRLITFWSGSFLLVIIFPLNARIFVIPYTKIIKMKEAIKWQKKILLKLIWN